MNKAHKQRKKNRIGRTGELFKKTGDIKGIFHIRMGMIKNRNGEDITETEEVKKK